MDIPHYPQLIQRLANTLRPGGMLILIESELSYVCDVPSLLCRPHYPSAGISHWPAGGHCTELVQVAQGRSRLPT